MLASEEALGPQHTCSTQCALGPFTPPPSLHCTGLDVGASQSRFQGRWPGCWSRLRFGKLLPQNIEGWSKTPKIPLHPSIPRPLVANHRELGGKLISFRLKKKKLFLYYTLVAVFVNHSSPENGNNPTVHQLMSGEWDLSM